MTDHRLQDGTYCAPLNKDKLSHAQAGYAYPANGTDHCIDCSRFHAPTRCQIVKSPISQDGWCEHYKE